MNEPEPQVGTSSPGATPAAEPAVQGPTATAASPPRSPEEAETYFVAYSEYSKTLRTWLVAYGVGGPVFLSNQYTLELLKKSGDAAVIARLFLIGVLLQVLMAAVNKVVMWGLYYGELEPAFRQLRRHKLCDWLSERLWIDFFVDVACIVLFLTATWRAFAALSLA